MSKETIEDMKDYEEFVRSVWTPHVNDDYRPIWAAAELAAEAGEVSGVAVKCVRKGKPLDKDKFKDELGDVLWSLTACALSVGTDLAGLAYHNHQKLTLRKEKEPERMGLPVEDHYNGA